jgi:hypothetical protein
MCSKGPWGALPMFIPSRRAMVSTPYVQSLLPIVLSIEVASDGERSLSQCRRVWEHSQSVGRGNGECSLCSLPMAGITLLR